MPGEYIMLTILKPIAASFGTTNFIVGLCLGQMGDQDAKKRVRNGDGPSIAWEAGHMLDHRCKVLKMLGIPKESPYAAMYTAKGASDGADYPEMPDLQLLWEQIHAELLTAIEAATPESLEKMIERGPHGPETTLDAIMFLGWHEAYHVGAMGAICKELGYPGPAELAIAKAAP
jgi:uncharacterized damage-inducible protein DinB